MKKWAIVGSFVIGGVLVLWLPRNQPLNIQTAQSMQKVVEPQESFKQYTVRENVIKIASPKEDKLQQILRRNHPAGRGWEALTQVEFEANLTVWVNEVQEELGEMSLEEMHELGAAIYDYESDPFLRYLAMGWMVYQVTDEGIEQDLMLKFSQDPIFFVSLESDEDKNPQEQIEYMLAEAMLAKKIPRSFGSAPDLDLINVLNLSVGGQRILRRWR